MPSIIHDFHGPNVGYVLELYDRYRQEPDSVDAATRAYFAAWTAPSEVEAYSASPQMAMPDRDTLDHIMAGHADQVMGVVNLAQSIREYGHLDAELDPLGSPPIHDPSLDLEAHGLEEADLAGLPSRLVGGPVAARTTSAHEAIQALREIYATTTGYDFDHLRNPRERAWLRDAVECQRYFPPQQPVDRVALLQRLTEVEAFEHFLQQTFPGKTRFSIEGLDMMVPMLDELLFLAAQRRITTALVGMAHRGRLNVLAHILNKPYAQILAEFKDPSAGRTFTVSDYLGWTGDVKYHLGAHRVIRDGELVQTLVSMAPNPSHLEAVNPVVQGMARAAGTRVHQPGPPLFDHTVTIPIVIHGDTAFSGQGVVAETLNFSQLAGYTTGGTVHIIANNQLGYTTEPKASRSTLYASDLAKGFKIPIVHVNADDPVACIAAARLAFAYLAEFQKDFLIDLIGYRRHGHNEGDEPSFTQPLLYRKIAAQPSVCTQWGHRLVAEELVAADRPDQLMQAQIAHLQAILDSLEPVTDLDEAKPQEPPRGAASQVRTGVPEPVLRHISADLARLPDGFLLNSKLSRIFERRRRATAEPDTAAIDWATAEELAFATILADGISIRITGQDVERGTFSQRHAVLHDEVDGRRHIPLQRLPQARAAFEILNSPLTENAAIGFEYGYNVQAPERLVIWEGQYGDFINGAQVMIDQFITSARSKWKLTPSLVLLLPHGYEGAGPDHSTGRLERFLQLAAETNMRVANCTTAAQFFHLLRRQAALLKTDPLPLVVMTPKSLLRHPLVASPLRDLVEGQWQPVLADHRAAAQPDQIRRLLLCSGKIYVDLISDSRWPAAEENAAVRLEQIYPFPTEALAPLLEQFPQLEELVWLQEEPANVGAWSFVRPHLRRLIAGRWPLRYVGRPRTSSPAEGSASWHKTNQQILLEHAFVRAELPHEIEMG